MRARAFKDWVEKLFPSRYEVIIEQVIENASWIGRFGVWVYNAIQRNFPALHNIYFFIVEVFTGLHTSRVTYGGTYYRNLLRRVRPEVVFSVHDSTNRGYFDDAKAIMGNTVRCVTYCGEFSGGYGFSRNWVSLQADLFIARTHTTLDQAVRCGLPRERVTIFHKLLPPSSFESRIPSEQIEHVRSDLGLDPHKFTLFLATGGFGANHHLPFLRVLVNLADKVQVIAICGRNPDLFERVQAWSKRHPQLRLVLEGYSGRIHEYLQVAHAVVTRGGANTTMEALHYNCPILYDTMGGLMPQEQCTVRYFEKYSAARLIRKTRDLHSFISDWSTFSENYEHTRSAFARLNPLELPHTLIEQILKPSGSQQ